MQVIAQDLNGDILLHTQTDRGSGEKPTRADTVESELWSRTGIVSADWFHFKTPEIRLVVL